MRGERSTCLYCASKIPVGMVCNCPHSILSPRSVSFEITTAGCQECEHLRTRMVELEAVVEKVRADIKATLGGTEE